MIVRLALALLLATTPALAEADPFTVDLACEPELGSTRLICKVDYASASGSRLRWADAVVTAAPSFAHPLRSRVLATVERDGASARARVALVTNGPGSGTLQLRARVVVCRAGSTDAAGCRALERALTVALVSS